MTTQIEAALAEIEARAKGTAEDLGGFYPILEQDIPKLVAALRAVITRCNDSEHPDEIAEDCIADIAQILSK